MTPPRSFLQRNKSRTPQRTISQSRTSKIRPPRWRNEKHEIDTDTRVKNGSIQDDLDLDKQEGLFLKNGDAAVPIVDDPHIQMVAHAFDLGDAQDCLTHSDHCEIAGQSKCKTRNEEELGPDFIRRERRRRDSLRLFVQELGE
jgi:hypothetical protein